MTWREWWEAFKEGVADLYPNSKPVPPAKPRFIPPRASQPDGKPQPEWPEKKDRQ